MNRRAFLWNSAAAALSSGLLTGCAAARRPVSLVQPIRTAPDLSLLGSACGLPPVHVSESRVIRTVAGLRPYRPSGFVVRPEKIGNTLVVHNYGHGGGGITLSWGTSKLAVDMGLPGHTGPVAVLGCGAVGLASARLAQEAGFAVTIYSKALPPETTSNVAGGQWFPVSISERDKRTPLYNQQFLAASEFAYKRYQILPAQRFGIRWMRNYFPSNDGFPETSYHGTDSPLRAMMPEFRDLGPNEHPFAGYKQARQFDTLLIEPPIYLAAMLEAFMVAGGKIVVRELPDRAAIGQLPEKLVFNCTGLGSKALFQDEELVPVKGQLTFLLPQPEIQYAVLAGDTYMFPRSDGILLGGTHETGVWSLEPDLVKKREIIAKHAAFFDSFKACKA